MLFLAITIVIKKRSVLATEVSPIILQGGQGKRGITVVLLHFK